MILSIITLVSLRILSSVNGQSRIPQGVNTRCYSTGDCTGPENEAYCQLFNSLTDNINHCCYDDSDLSMPRSNPNMLSFTLNGGGCRRCDDASVTNSETYECFSTCDPLSPGNNMVTGTMDIVTGNENDCCATSSTTSGYGVDSMTCTLCHDIGSDMSVACDPHFYLPLANGDHMCFSVQGEPNFAFNLISDKYIKLNAQFVLPAKDGSNAIANVSTFLGDLGMVVLNRQTDKAVVIHVSAEDHSVLVENSLTVAKDKAVFVDVSNSTVAINVKADSQTTKLMKDESAWLYINTEGFGIKVRFYKKHLDMFFTKTSGLSKDARGLIGQFLTADVNIDMENMLMKLGDRNPISVKRDKAWPHLGINAECWYGVDTNNQGAGIIDGIYTDYIVDELIPVRN